MKRLIFILLIAAMSVAGHAAGAQVRQTAKGLSSAQKVGIVASRTLQSVNKINGTQIKGVPQVRPTGWLVGPIPAPKPFDIAERMKEETKKLEQMKARIDSLKIKTHRILGSANMPTETSASVESADTPSAEDAETAAECTESTLERAESTSEGIAGAVSSLEVVPVDSGILLTDIYNYLIEFPTDEVMQDLLLESTDCPVEMGFSLYEDIMERHFPFDSFNYSFEWADMSDNTPEENEIIKGAVAIGRKALKAEDDRSDDFFAKALLFDIAMQLTEDSTEVDNAKKYLAYLDKELAATPDRCYDGLRASLVLGNAYIAGHGLDAPEKAYEILNTDINKFCRWDLTPLARQMRFRYLQYVCEALGKPSAARYKEIAERALNAEHADHGELIDNEELSEE